MHLLFHYWYTLFQRGYILITHLDITHILNYTQNED